MAWAIAFATCGQQTGVKKKRVAPSDPVVTEQFTGYLFAYFEGSRGRHRTASDRGAASFCCE